MKLTIPVNSSDHIQGEKDATVTLVEYGDFECPYCGRAYPIVKRLQEMEGNKILFVFRNFPLSEVHPHALHAAYAAEAAAKLGKFWEMHDLLFENQQALEDIDLLAYAKELNLDIPQFSEDMKTEEVIKKVQNDFISGVRSGVNGTPTFFINGQRHDGSYELDFLMEAIEMAANTKQKGEATK